MHIESDDDDDDEPIGDNLAEEEVQDGDQPLNKVNRKGQGKKPRHNGSLTIEYRKELSKVTTLEKDAGIRKLTVEGCGYNVKVVKAGAGNLRKDGTRRTSLLCPFYREADCKWRLNTVEYNDGTWDLMVPVQPHHMFGSHTNLAPKYDPGKHLTVFAKSQLPPEIIDRGASKAVSFIAEKGIGMPEAVQSKLKNFLKSTKRKRNNGGVENALANTYGVFHNVCMKYALEDSALPGELLVSKVQLSGSEDCYRKAFDEHTPYLVGFHVGTVTKDGEEVPSWCYVFSTYNLLLNTYRKTQSTDSPVIQIGVDATYRVNQEGYGHLVFTVFDPSQKTHVVAYAIVSHEDTNTHEKFFDIVKTESEKLVAAKQKAGEMI